MCNVAFQSFELWLYFAPALFVLAKIRDYQQSFLTLMVNNNVSVGYWSQAKLNHNMLSLFFT